MLDSARVLPCHTGSTDDFMDSECALNVRTCGCRTRNAVNTASRQLTFGAQLALLLHPGYFV